MKRVRLAFLCALAVVAGACGGGGGKATYSVGKLADAVVQQSEAPKGTVLVGQASGQLDIDRFPSDASEKRALREHNFQGAQQAVYITPALQSGGAPPPHASQVGSFAVVFEDVSDARKMYDFYKQDWLPTRLEGEESLPDPDFGQASFGNRFSSFTLAPFPGVAYMWRDDNAVFAVLRASPERLETTPGQVLALGKAMESRAQKAKED